MTPKLKQALAAVRQLTVAQLRTSIEHCDELIASTRAQMKTMGTQYKLRVGIPRLRDLDAFRRKFVAELERRQVH